MGHSLSLRIQVGWCYLALALGSGSLLLTGCGGSQSAESSSTPQPATIAALSPASVIAGGAAFTLTVTGSGFAASSQVLWNGAARTTTFVSSTSLTAAIAAADIATTGSNNVSVMNGSIASAVAVFPVNAPASPAPVLSSIAPQSAIAGSGDLVLTLLGQNFASDSTVQFGSSKLSAQFGGSSSVLTATVPAALLATVGSYTVTVSTPSAGVSAALSFQVTAPPPPAITGLLAISDDGQFLYVALDGSSAVQRFVLPGLTADITVSLGADPFFGPNTALDLGVAPGAPHTWAVTVGNLGVSPAAQGGLSVFDDGAQRGASEGRNHFQGSGAFDLLLGTIVWGKDASVIYGANNESTGFDFYSIPVSASGPGVVQDYGGAMPGFDNPHIHFEPVTQLVYGDDGYVVNPATGDAAGQYAYYGVMTPDGALNQAYFIANLGSSGNAGTIAAFNLTKFTPTGLYNFPNVTGSPIRLVRWGVSGLAFNTLAYDYTGPATTKLGKIFIYSGALVSAAAADRKAGPSR